MERYFIDCREHPSDVKCTVALSADTKEELLEAVVQHGTKVIASDLLQTLAFYTQNV